LGSRPFGSGGRFFYFWQGLWQVDLSTAFSRRLIIFSAVFSLLLLEIAISLSFWPVSVVVGSLFLTVFVYILLGLGQAKLEARFFSQTVKEYLTVAVFVLLAMFFATHWGE